MTGGDRSMGDVVRQSLDGQLAANHLLHDIATTNPNPDMLLERLREVVTTGEAERLRGFARVLQKRLESRLYA